jgi:hypothetical protein
VSLIIYIIIKYFAYWLLCLVAPRFLKLSWNNLVKEALIWGLLRLFIGFMAGFMIVFLYATLAVSSVFGGLLILLPVRWFEWRILAILMQKHSSLSLMTILVGKTSRERVWVALGVAVSCSLDLLLRDALNHVHWC